MRTSKWTSLAVLSLPLVLVACSLPEPAKQTGDSAQGTSADFYIESVQGSVLVETQEKTTYSMDSVRTFNFKACLKDLARSKNIQNQNFEVVEAQTTTRTDMSGCIAWSEKINFNPLSEARYLLHTRSIKGTGLFKGSQKAEFAINPWTENSSQMVLDAKRNQIPQLVRDKEEISARLAGTSTGTQIASGTTASNQHKLWVEDGRLFVTEQSINAEGIKVQVEVRTLPTVQLKKMNGELQFRPLTSGDFKAQLILMHKVEMDGKEIFKELGRGEEVNESMKANNLSVRSQITLPFVPTRGQLFIGLRLEAKDRELGLAPFEGFYLIGDHDRLKGTVFMKLSSRVAEEKNFRLAQLISGKVTESDLMDLPYQRAKVEIAPLEFRFIRVGKETTTNREVVINVRACVRNGLDQNPLRSSNFKVTKFRQSQSESAQYAQVRTDNNSCINWEETINFKYFDCQRFIPGSIKIENKELGLNENLAVLINPWEAWGSPGRDVRYVEQHERHITECSQDKRLRSQLLIDMYSYNTLSYDYEVDDTLSLTVKKKVQFKVEPKVLIYSNLSNGRSEIQRLRDGLYLLKVAVVKNREYNNHKHAYITHDEKIVPALNGTINTDLTFKTQDLKALGNRNTILVEVYPIDEEKLKSLKVSDNKDLAIDKNAGLDSTTFEGIVVLNMDDTTKTLRSTSMEKMADYFLDLKDIKSEESVINKVVREGVESLQQLYTQRKSQAKAESFARYANLQMVRLNQDPHPLIKKIPASELTDFVTSGKMNSQLMQRLCHYWFNEHLAEQHKKHGASFTQGLGNNAYRSCLSAQGEKLDQFFLTEKRFIVNKIQNSKYLKGYNKGLSVGTSFSLSNSHNESITSTASLSAKAGLGFKFFDLLSAGLDATYQISNATSDTVSESNGVSIGAQTSMAVQINSFELTLGSYEQCAVVRLNPLLFAKDSKNPWWNKRSNLLYLLNRNLNDEAKAKIAQSGLLICSGVVQNHPIKRTETFYLINQDQTQTSMQDNADERNRNFFMALRGKSEFNKFMVAVKAQNNLPTTNDRQESIESKMLSDLEKVFTFGLPLFPANYVE